MERTDYVKQQGSRSEQTYSNGYRNSNCVDYEADHRYGAEFSRRARMFRDHVSSMHLSILTFCRNFINLVRDPKATEDGDDDFIDDALPHVALPVSLPPPNISNLEFIDNVVQQSVMTPGGRESLVAFIQEEACHLTVFN